MTAHLVVTPYDTPPTERGDTDQAWFRVLEGPGTWLVATEHADAPTGQAAGSQVYAEIFASADAGPFTGYGPHVFSIEIDVSADADLTEFHDWYDRVHVPVVAPAGLLRGRRFAAVGVTRTFLAVYDMADRDVLSSRALAEVRGFDHFEPFVTIRHRRVLERVA